MATHHPHATFPRAALCGPPSRGRATARIVGVVVGIAAGALAGCDAEARESDESGALRVTPVSSPTGPAASEPSLSTVGDAAVLTWLHAPDEGPVVLRAARLGPEGSWDALPDIVRSDSLLVNWADFPGTTSLGGERLAVWWLVRGPAGGLDYSIRVAVSEDGGRSWGASWTPHEDGLPAEHGFVSVLPEPEGRARVVWLDGRRYHTSDDGPMELRTRLFGPEGPEGDEEVLDARVCDCCQTDAVRTDAGAVVVYRDRTEGEIRDVLAAPIGPDGWEEPRPVQDDGWEIGGCPVNGPQVAHGSGRTAVAWFTAADGEPRVLLAFSEDGGRTFGTPLRIDTGGAAGRVDVAVLEGGTAVVSWIERSGREGALMLRTATSDGHLGTPVRAAAPGAERSAGFPRMTGLPGGDLLLAWTVPGEPSTVELARVDPEGGE